MRPWLETKSPMIHLPKATIVASSLLIPCNCRRDYSIMSRLSRGSNHSECAKRMGSCSRPMRSPRVAVHSAYKVHTRVLCMEKHPGLPELSIAAIDTRNHAGRNWNRALRRLPCSQIRATQYKMCYTCVHSGRKCTTMPFKDM